MKVMLEELTKQKHQTDKEINAMKTELDACRRNNNNTHVEGKLEPPTDRERVPPSSTSRQVPPPHGYPMKLLYSYVMARREAGKFKLSLRTKSSHTPDEIQSLLKAKVNTTEINVGITSLKSLRDGKVIIEVGSKKEIDTVEEKIKERCGEELEIRVHRLRNPRLVILNTPTDITRENIKEILVQQNRELAINNGNIEPKFSYITKRGTRNLVIELDPGTRRKLI